MGVVESESRDKVSLGTLEGRNKVNIKIVIDLSPLRVPSILTLRRIRAVSYRTVFIRVTWRIRHTEGRTFVSLFHRPWDLGASGAIFGSDSRVAFLHDGLTCYLY